MKDRFGNVPYALVYNYGREVAFTRDEYERAVKTAKMCRCGECDCCVIARYTDHTGGDNA